MSGDNAGLAAAAYSDFLPEFMDAVERVSADYLDDYDLHEAFAYLIAEQFESVSDDVFVYTDGPGDEGVDFYARSANSYAIYQCKCPDDTQLDTRLEPHSYGIEAVTDLLRAVDYITGERPRESASASLRDLRSRYHRDLSESVGTTLLTACLAVFGELSPAALEHYVAQRDALIAQGVALQVVNWADLRERMHVAEAAPCPGMEILLQVDRRRDMLEQHDWLYALVRAKDVVRAMDQYGVQLFDLNVRNELTSSSVNRGIIDTVRNSEGRGNFQHLNNGLLITCTDYSLEPSRGEPDEPVVIRVEEPQVINGCQTVSTLHRAYTQIMTTQERALFDGEVRVQAKIIRGASTQLVDEIVITTNNQNPMNPRNLKSNTPEQKRIARLFDELYPRWFYVRKDGQFEALRSQRHPDRAFDESDYAVAGAGRARRFRVIDNQTLARDWYSWIGMSNQVLKGGLFYFSKEDLYEDVFESKPNQEFWSRFADPAFYKLTDDLFDADTPTAHQYLLAHAVATYLRRTSVSAHHNKRTALLRGLKKGVLSGNEATGDIYATPREQAEYLARDFDYTLNSWFNQSRDLHIELFAFVLVRRYGQLDGATCRKLLALPDLSCWCDSGFSRPIESLREEYQDGLLERTAAFVRWAAGNYANMHQAEVEAASRVKNFFARRETVVQMRAELLEYDERTTRGGQPWHFDGGSTFIESLPELS